MKKIKVLVLNVDELPEVREIDKTSEAYREIVGGWLECVRIADDIDMWINEEGLLIELPVNFHTFIVDNGVPQHVHTIHGNVFFASHDGEGDIIGLNDEQINRVRFMFRANRKACIVR